MPIPDYIDLSRCLPRSSRGYQFVSNAAALTPCDRVARFARVQLLVQGAKRFFFVSIVEISEARRGEASRGTAQRGEPI